MSVLLNWLKETYSDQVVAFCADIGQKEELDGREEKALKIGARKCYVDNRREEFARDFIFSIMAAGAIHEGQYFLGTSIARPLSRGIGLQPMKKPLERRDQAWDAGEDSCVPQAPGKRATAQAGVLRPRPSIGRAARECLAV